MAADIMRDTFAWLMHDTGVADPSLVVLVGDISRFALQPLRRACPGASTTSAFSNQPSSACRLAGQLGLRTVAYTIAPFLIERSLEQIKLDFCYQAPAAR